MFWNTQLKRVYIKDKFDTKGSNTTSRGSVMAYLYEVVKHNSKLKLISKGTNPNKFQKQDIKGILPLSQSELT